MGQSPSSVRSKSGRQRSFRGFVRRSKLNNSSLSHTFSLPPSEEYPELMNVNCATEEQLMTLPGVGRPLARAIVRHRQIIGRFKRVDDLALVSGIGADKLELLRPEICTNTKKQLSRASSLTQSLESTRCSLDSRLCSVNSASVFTLQCVPGLNQEIAANIVDYRNKKGPFKSLDDLIKVRGMDIVRLSTVKHHLSLEPRKCESELLLTNGHMNRWLTNVSMNGSLNSGSGTSSTPKTAHRKSLSMPSQFPITLPNGFATAPVNDILDLLSAYSHRPVVEENFRYERDGTKCCRLGTWNLHQLSLDKINNPGVREVVCRTILENKISLIAIQEVEEEAALKAICDELNAPELRRVRQWFANSRTWRHCGCGDSRLGFLYEACNKAGGIDIDAVPLERLTPGARALAAELARLPAHSVATQAFLVNGRPLVLLNALSSVPGVPGEAAARCAAGAGVPLALAASLPPADEPAGEGAPPTEARQCELQCLVESACDDGRGALLCGGAGGAGGAALWGRAGAVRGGLAHLAIPRGWSWGGRASPHCPLWAELSLPD